MFTWIDPDSATPAKVGLTCVSNHDAGPYFRGTDIYIIAQNDDGTLLTAWKSADGGASWTAMDAAHSPVPVPDTANPDESSAWYGTDTDGTNIYTVFYTVLNSTGGNVMTLSAFDMSTDTWGSPAVITTLTPFGGEDTYRTGVFFIPSTSALIIVYSIDDSIGTIRTDFIAVDTAGAILSGPTTVLPTQGFLPRACISHAGSPGEYWVNVFATENNQQNIYHRSVSETYSLGSVQLIGIMGTSPLYVDGQPTGSNIIYTGHPDPPCSANGEIFFPCYVRARVGLSGSAHDGWLITVFRMTIQADPTWVVDTLQEVYSVTPNVFPNPPAGPFQVNGPVQQVFGTDGTTYPVHLCVFVDEHGDVGIFAMNEGAPQNILRSDYTAVSPEFWTDVVRVSDSNDPDQFFWPGQFEETYFSVNVVSQGLDLVMGRDFSFPGTGVGRKASTLLLSAGTFGNVWRGATQHIGNCFGD